MHKSVGDAVKELYDMAKDLRIPFDETSFVRAVRVEDFGRAMFRDIFVWNRLQQARKLRYNTVKTMRTFLFLSIKRAYPRVPKDVVKLICRLV